MKLYYNKTEYEALAQELCSHLQAETVSDPEEINDGELFLCMDEKGLSLRSGPLSLRDDFSEMLPRVRNGMWKHELLCKAAKLKDFDGKKTLVDLTAGMGVDSFLLAAAGYNVTMIEYDPVIAALLRDALRRGREADGVSGIVSRMSLLEGDSLREIARFSEAPDVIYLDPMFPERKKTGLVKKKFQLLHRLEKPCENGEEFLEAALLRRPQRVIIKRPANGPYLGGKKPDWSLSGGQIRYDIFTRKGEAHG